MRNKIVLIIIFCMLPFLIISEEKITVIKRFYALNHVNNEMAILFVEYDIYLGFKVGDVYLMTEKEKFRSTVNKNKKNYMWFIFVRSGCGEVLKAMNPIWAIAIYDYETDIITIVFNLNIFSFDTMNHYAIGFYRKYIKRYY